MFDERVDPDNNELLISKAQRALVAMRLGRDEEAIYYMGLSNESESSSLADEQLTSEDSADSHSTDRSSNTAETRQLMLLLFSACSAMVTELGDGGKAPVKVQVFDDHGAEVSIDQADPPVRTAVRTLLAEVHGNTEAAAEQLEIALENAIPEEAEILVSQALRWTMRLHSECVERNLPVAPWITSALS